MFESVLIANRGEIACRVIRTLRSMGIRSIAVYSDADVDARHVREADEAVLLGAAAPRESYLNIAKVVEAAIRTGAQAVHPGYGFLAENADFAQALAAAGIVFIGPTVEAVKVMGDKITARDAVTANGVPVVPGIAERGLSDQQLIDAAAKIGYPVLIKPAAGGGGKGMRAVLDPADLPANLVSARRESRGAFGDDTLFLERLVARPRHIEVQVLADSFANTIHLGERECSLQRRHQKVIEEAPSPIVTPELRARLGQAAVEAARSVGYQSAGTVEFIVGGDDPDQFFFLEMNTRLQVEHPVTELVTGIDLVEWQVRIAAGEKLTLTQDDIAFTGHAIEARVYAEDPASDFLPTGGTILELSEPTGVRVDSAMLPGLVVGSDYDPMLAKVIAHGPTRAAAIARLEHALAATRIVGVTTNTAFNRFLLNDPDVRAGNLDTGLIDRLMPTFTALGSRDEYFVAAAVALWIANWPAGESDPWTVPSGWRLSGSAPTVFDLTGQGTQTRVEIVGTPSAATITVGDNVPQSAVVSAVDSGVAITVDGHRTSFRVREQDGSIWVAGRLGAAEIRRSKPKAAGARSGAEEPEVTSPMPGLVIAVHEGIPMSPRERSWPSSRR